MKIDLQIGYDDLSNECKEQLKQLKLLGFKVSLHYPTIIKDQGFEYISPSTISINTNGLQWGQLDSGTTSYNTASSGSSSNSASN